MGYLIQYLARRFKYLWRVLWGEATPMVPVEDSSMEYTGPTHKPWGENETVVCDPNNIRRWIKVPDYLVLDLDNMR